MDNNALYLKPGYRSRTEPLYYAAETVAGITHQPVVYDFAAYLAKQYGCSTMIDLGCGRASKLAKLHPEVHILGVDFGENLEYCREHHSFGEWISHDFELGPLTSISRTTAVSAVVVCADVVEHLVDPSHLLETIRNLLEDAPVAILTTPERDLCRGPDDIGPPANQFHVREWSLSEFQLLLESAGLEVLFHGLTFDNDVDWKKHTILSVIRRRREIPPPPSDFRVIALVGAYNEEDVIESFLEHTIRQGVDVLLLDNWSTDRTAERAARFLNRGLIGIRKFPEEGPSAHHEWHRMLRKKEELASYLAADWFIHVDPDELRESPWPKVTLREALYRVDYEGFNAVNHTCVTFPPTGSGYRDDLPLEQQFQYFEFGVHAGHLVQVKAWKRQPTRVECADSGGHEARFAGRRVYPFRFLLKHYPIRSPEHGRKKVFQERRPRFSPELRQRGWHIQYDHILEDEAFVKDPSTLSHFRPETFYSEYLVERLSTIGIWLPGAAAPMEYRGQE
ncbi:MAG: glycosyltransferase family 2 protein [Ignavibacteriota bacterium]